MVLIVTKLHGIPLDLSVTGEERGHKVYRSAG